MKNEIEKEIKIHNIYNFYHHFIQQRKVKARYRL